MDPLKNLTESELASLIAAPAWVTILIAGADKKIDTSEKNWANRLVKYRTFTSDPYLNGYYTQVKDAFEENMEAGLAKWDPEKGEATMKEALTGLKGILENLDPAYAQRLKDSLRSLAKEVAEASGGFLGMGSISADEKRLLDLAMLD